MWWLCGVDVVWIGMMWCGVVRYWFVCGGWLMHNGTIFGLLVFKKVQILRNYQT